MGIFSGIFKSRDAPTNRTAGSAYSFFLGQSAAGKRVNERSAMQTSAVYACVRVISESVASLPLHLYRYNKDGGKEKAIDHPLYHLLHDEPNPEMTAYSFFEVALTHLLLWGNSYSQIIRNGKGEVIGLYPLMPDRMTVDRDEKGHLYYEYMVSSDDAPTNKGSTVRLKPEDVLHVPGLSFDGLVGYSPIAMAKNAIGLGIAAEEYSGFLFLDKDHMPLVAMHWEHRFNSMVGRYNEIYKVQIPNITPHVCRHTYCSNQAKAGMNPKTLQYLMGHSDIAVTLNVYTHVGLEDAENELRKMQTLEGARKEMGLSDKDDKPLKQTMFKVV